MEEQPKCLSCGTPLMGITIDGKIVGVAEAWAVYSDGKFIGYRCDNCQKQERDRGGA